VQLADGAGGSRLGEAGGVNQIRRAVGGVRARSPVRVADEHRARVDVAAGEVRDVGGRGRAGESPVQARPRPERLRLAGGVRRGAGNLPVVEDGADDAVVVEVRAEAGHVVDVVDRGDVGLVEV